MDKTRVEATLDKLRQDRDNFLASYNRLVGAVEILESMLAEWDKPVE